MAQLREDEFPRDDEPTTTEDQIIRDPINGPKDPERREPGKTPTPVTEPPPTEDNPQPPHSDPEVPPIGPPR